MHGSSGALRPITPPQTCHVPLEATNTSTSDTTNPVLISNSIQYRTTCSDSPKLLGDTTWDIIPRPASKPHDIDIFRHNVSCGCGRDQSHERSWNCLPYEIISRVFGGYCSRSPDHMKYPTGGDTIIDGQKSGPARAFLVSTFNRTQLPSSTLYVSMK